MNTSALFYADDVNLLEHNINTERKNTETLINASKEVGIEENTEKTKLLSRHQNGGQNHDMKIANRCNENGAHFRYLRSTTTD
jgi:hypothetical protein